ncbi:guanosine monophosphate reductase [candidate division WWE3 bacterium]|nr:guanosine monophosphate reductase [candidate division WWE3 bacterium]
MTLITPGSRIVSEAITFDDILLVPRKSLPSRSTADLQGKLTKKISLPVPLVSANMDTITEAGMMNTLALLGALGILHRNNSIEEQVGQVISHKKFLVSNDKSNYPIVASIGVNKDYQRRCESLAEAGVIAIVVDIAHGYSDKLAEAVKFVKNRLPGMEIIAGNVCNPEALKFVGDIGVDSVKVGIGGGSMCQTRVVTGFGVPMVTAIESCFEAAQSFGIPIIADGGHRVCGDVVKALWAGADSVMLGGMLAATAEAPGELVELDDIFYKEYRGMASIEARSSNHMDEGKEQSPEGVSTYKRFKGSVVPIVKDLITGMGSAFSYGNARNLEELRECQAHKITPNVNTLNIPHGIEK